MAWAAIVTQITKNETNAVAIVDFIESSTKEKITRLVPANDLNPASLATFCQRVIEELETRDMALAALASGPVVLPRDRSATPDETARAAADAYFNARLTYQKYQAAVAAGDMKADDKAVSDATMALKAQPFLPEYTSDFRYT